MESGSQKRLRSARAPAVTVRRFSPSRILGTDKEISQTNIALLQQYGANSWKVHNYLLEATSKQLEKAVEDLTQLTTDLNRDRKNSQASSLLFRRDEHRLTGA
jgi:hypothetical protein